MMIRSIFFTTAVLALVFAAPNARAALCFQYTKRRGRNRRSPGEPTRA
jgi:hypothetical protein